MKIPLSCQGPQEHNPLSYVVFVLFIRAEKMGHNSLRSNKCPISSNAFSREPRGREAKPLKSGTRIRRPAGAEIGCAGWGSQALRCAILDSGDVRCGMF